MAAAAICRKTRRTTLKSINIASGIFGSESTRNPSDNRNTLSYILWLICSCGDAIRIWAADG